MFKSLHDIFSKNTFKNAAISVVKNPATLFFSVGAVATYVELKREIHPEIKLMRAKNPDLGRGPRL